MIFNLMLILALVLSAVAVYQNPKGLINWAVLLISIVLVWPVLQKLLG